MTTKKFLQLCIEKNIPILPRKSEKLDKYKELTERFKYSCRFNEKGVCIAHYWETKDPSKMCCCGDCAQNIGYLRFIRGTHMVDEYAAKYDETTGFWRPGKDNSPKTAFAGCILPRKLMSTTCVAFVCCPIYEQFKISNGKKAVRFMKLLGYYDRLLPKDKSDLHTLYLQVNHTHQHSSDNKKTI